MFSTGINLRDFKNLTRRKASDKITRDKEFNTAKNQKYDGYQHGIASTVYKFYDEKASGSSIKNAKFETKN